MAQPEDGWPLGLLQPVNARVTGLWRNHDRNGSISFSTLITGSPTSSTDSNSDLDTESTGSFFRDRSITLGSLMGVSNILELSRRSTRGRPTENLRDKKNCKSKPWLFSLCSKLDTDAVNMSNGTAPSLGHFLDSERKAASFYRRNPGSHVYGPDDFFQDPNLLFVNGHIAPPQSSSWLDSNGERRSNKGLFENGNGYGAPLLLSCLCGQLIE